MQLVYANYQNIVNATPARVIGLRRFPVFCPASLPVMRHGLSSAPYQGAAGMAPA